MGVDPAGAGLLVKQTAGLGALFGKGHGQIGKPDVIDRRVGFAAEENAALAGQGQVVEAHIANHAGEVLLPGTAGGADEERLALAPPARRTGDGVPVGIAAGGPGQVVNLDVFNGAAVPHPDPDGAGAVVNNAVGQYNVADHTVGFGADLERGVPRVEHAAADCDVLARAIPPGHRAGGFDDNRVVTCADDTVPDHNILAAVGVDAVVVRAAVIVQNADALNPHAAAACHVQRPEGGVFQRHVPDGQILDIFKQQHARAEVGAGFGTFMEAVVLVFIKKDLTALAVDGAGAADRDVARALGPKEEPAGPAVYLIIAAGGAEGLDCRRVK